MENSQQESREGVHSEENVQQGQEAPPELEQEYQVIEGATEQKNLRPKSSDNNEDRSGFTYGLSTGLGIGCIATFVIIWVAVFFTPQLPSGVTYESLLSIFIYPLVYLLAVGLIALTAGIVRQYFSRSKV
jgi:fructose-specific phosphotransferase system IIC component